jgi:hypothetical protein
MISNGPKSWIGVPIQVAAALGVQQQDMPEHRYQEGDARLLAWLQAWVRRLKAPACMEMPTACGQMAALAEAGHEIRLHDLPAIVVPASRVRCLPGASTVSGSADGARLRWPWRSDCTPSSSKPGDPGWPGHHRAIILAGARDHPDPI